MKNATILALFLILAGTTLLWFGSSRPVQIIATENITTIETHAWNVSRVLRDAAVSLGMHDSVIPALDEQTGWQNPIVIERASQVRIIDLTRALDITVPSRERLPANLLLEAGLALFPGDLVLLNGQSVDAGTPLAYQPAFTLQVIPSQSVELLADEGLQRVNSTLPSLGQALWAAGVQLRAADQLSENLQNSLRFLETVTLQRARPVVIGSSKQRLSILTAGASTGEILRQAGVALQDLDYSIPSEDAPPPKSGSIQIVRVHEAMEFDQTVIPYTSETMLDAETELDQRRIIEAGQYGLKVTRTRIRYENGIETTRQTDAEWLAAEPKAELIGIGTQVVLKTIETPQGTLEYWRTINAYATSYSPCQIGTGECSYFTASGLELQRGVIAVACSIFSTFRGQQVYIPGYGTATIADCGGGVPGTFWVDLGFSDTDYESWHQNVTVYFLTPIPAYIPYELQ